MLLPRPLVLASILAAALAPPLAGAQTAPLTPDIPASFQTPTAANDYVKRVVMIP
ncbi:MAG: hypothetical protein HOQ08_14235, partial [Frateuria sp.]|nr:hypothetical protein [Frateuria sp.]